MGANLLSMPINQPSIAAAQTKAENLRGAQNRNLLAEQQLSTFQGDQAWKEESRQAQRDANEYVGYKRKMEKATEPLQKLEAFDKAFKLTAGKLSLSNYDAGIKKLQADFGVDVQFKPAAQIEAEAIKAGMNPEAYFKNVHLVNQLASWDAKYQSQAALIKSATDKAADLSTYEKKLDYKYKKDLEAAKGKPLKAAIDLFYKNHPDPSDEELFDFLKAKKKAEAAGTREGKGADKNAKNYLLPDKTIVTSFDGGHTFKGEDGTTQSLPFNAVEVSAKVTGDDLSKFAAQKQVKGAGRVAALPEVDAKKVAEGGTGPFSALAGGIDAMLGGANIDVLFGKEGFFPETQENRQQLRTIKQVGKAALLNSSRGATWEQKKIDKLFPDPDKFFTNPRTEAKKFKTIRETLTREKVFNNKAILDAVTPKEVEKLRTANTEIDRLFALIGTGKPKNESGLSDEENALIDQFLPK